MRTVRRRLSAPGGLRCTILGRALRRCCLGRCSLREGHHAARWRPEGIDLDEVADALASTAGVAGVHDLHIWALTSAAPSVSTHLLICDGTDTDAVRIAVAHTHAHRFQTHHVTLQTERVDCRTLEGFAVVH